MYKTTFRSLSRSDCPFSVRVTTKLWQKDKKKLFDPRRVKAKKFALHEIKATIMTKTLVNNDTLFESSSCLWITI